MIRLLVGKDILGMIAEECGLQPKVKPDPLGDVRSNFVQLVLPVLCGNSRLEFYSNVRQEEAVIPPIVPREEYAVDENTVYRT